MTIANGHDQRKPILIVDDDQGHRLACRELLEHHGHLVEEASDGSKALHRLTDRGAPTPALVLLDLSTPPMDGWKLLAIMKSYTRLRTIPVILLTADEPGLDPVRHGTVAAHLRKPYDPQALVTLAAQFGTP